MGVSNIEKIVGSLLKAGWPPQTKIAAVERGTFYNQRVVTGTLESFVQIVQQASLCTPAVLIVGKVVELHEKLNWFARKPRVLVLGTHPEKYAHLGTIVHRPIVECVGLEDYSRLDEAIKRIGEFDWLIFTSANGVRFFFKRLRLNDLDVRAMCSLRVAVIGKTTARRLAGFGILADLVPGTESSAGLLKEFKTLKIRGKKVLLPQARAASGELAEGLVRMGATVEEAPAYETVEMEPADVDLEYIDKILFTSGSTVRAFVKKFGRVPSRIKAYCLGVPTQQEAKKHGIDAEILPQQGN
jgi:uroporphyrinogen III methyltransferase/synthase